MSENPIPSLLEEFGSEAKLAAAIGVSQPAIHKAKGLARVSAQMAMRIEELTAGRFKRWQMRPDMWDAPADTEAA